MSASKIDGVKIKFTSAGDRRHQAEWGGYTCVVSSTGFFTDPVAHGVTDNGFPIRCEHGNWQQAAKNCLLELRTAREMAALQETDMTESECESEYERRAVEAERKLAVVRAHVLGGPDHPWIPGASFADPELRSALGLETPARFQPGGLLADQPEARDG